jgi:hypothetical protein
VRLISAYESFWATILLCRIAAKAEFSKELLHESNNQLEIVMAAAELLSRQYFERATKECCAQIQSGSDIHSTGAGCRLPGRYAAVIGRA